MTEQVMLPEVEVEVEVEDSSDTEFTPPSVFEPVLRALGMDEFDFDPCSHAQAPLPARFRIIPPHDGLSLQWPDEGIGWLNPPYSAPGRWLERASSWATRNPRHAFVGLLKLDPTTQWWRQFVDRSVGFLLLHDRVRHIKPGRAKNDVAMFASALVTWGGDKRTLDVLRMLDGVMGRGLVLDRFFEFLVHNGAHATGFETEHQADARLIAERIEREGGR